MDTKILSEGELFRRGYKSILAIDEAGRGPLAGPLIVAGLLIRPQTLPILMKLGADDSKRLQPTKRIQIFQAIKKFKLSYQIISTAPTLIDRHGIQAAWQKSITKLIKKFKADFVLIDGVKLATAGEHRGKTTVEFWIKGDQRFASIGAASIIAKVTRDQLMIRLAKKYPRYHLDQHKGYGTAQHMALIKKYGLSAVHRRSFCKFLLRRSEP